MKLMAQAQSHLKMDAHQTLEKARVQATKAVEIYNIKLAETNARLASHWKTDLPVALQDFQDIEMRRLQVSCAFVGMAIDQENLV